jgi:hypothetical protein
MEAPVDEAAVDEAEPVPAADELVGAPSPEHTPVDVEGEEAEAGPAPRDPNLPDVAPSAMPAEAPPSEPSLPAVAPSAMPGAAPPAAEPSTTSAPAATEQPQPAAAAPVAGTGERQDWPAGQPVWDPARGTYIFWDPATGEWLQFDYASGAWGPISRAG